MIFLRFIGEKSKAGTALALVTTERLFVAAVKTACLLECECNHGDSFLSLATFWDIDGSIVTYLNVIAIHDV